MSSVVLIGFRGIVDYYQHSLQISALTTKRYTDLFSINSLCCYFDDKSGREEMFSTVDSKP